MTASVARWMESRGLLVRPEFQTPWGPCDLVGCSIHVPRARLRLSHGQTKQIGSPQKAMVILHSPDVEQASSATVAELASRLEGIMTKNEVESAVARLARDK